ncbi:MAG: glycosyltransferase family 4 protein [Candidatus Aenigmatarchaeota archaeon]
MRIAFFSWEYMPFLVGGLGTYSMNMIKKFVEHGNEVSVFTMGLKNSKEFEEVDGIKVYRFSFLDNSKAISIFANNDILGWGEGLKLFSDVFNYNFLSVNKFIELQKKERFDVIAIHDWISAFSGLILKQIKVPIVFHLHSVEEVRNFPGSETLKRLEREMAREADKIITVSEAMRDFVSSIGYDREKISVCWNGTDPETLDPKKIDSRVVEKLRKKYNVGEDKVIFFIGRLVWFKGIYNLVKAMDFVLKEFPNTKLIMVGIGESENLRQHIKALGLEKNVVLINKWLSNEEKLAHFALADVCVFPSLNEPFGIVASEAMSMEKPVVVGASGVSGFKEQIVPSGEKRTGVHVDGKSPEDIAWGIKEVLRNPEEAKKWGENGRRLVLEKFNFELAARKTLSIYESLTK